MKIVIFASGTGTNAEAMINYSRQNSIEVCGLFCDKPTALVIKKAKAAQIKTFIIPYQKLENRESSRSLHEQTILNELKKIEFDWICLAGYMRIFSASFIKKFFSQKFGFSKIINIHPSLLPSFKGMNAYEMAYESGVQVSGISIHLVAAQVDSGPILMQESFQREKSDSLADFKSKGLKIEHELYCKLLAHLIKFEPYLKNDSNFVFWRDQCV